MPEHERTAVGPQYEGDDALTARMRLHQSWYRAEILGLPCGTGPQHSSQRALGSMLRPEDGDRGRNYLSQPIFALVKARMAEGAGVDPFRALCNMLSSQPMCFNLLGPLIADEPLALRLLRRTFGERVHRVRRVAIEWAPSPRREYLDDATSFDAVVEYEGADGRLGIVGIETKLTEPFSQQRYDRPAYRRWTEATGRFRPEAHLLLADVQFNQLWRNHLLQLAMVHARGSRYSEGLTAIIRHPLDARCESTLQSYRSLLRQPEDVLDLPLDRLVASWRDELGSGTWLDDFAARYLELERSAHLVSTAGGPSTAKVTSAVTRGHLRSLALLEDIDAYRETRALYAHRIGQCGVYLRPTDAGLTVISLDAAGCSAMVGVGSRDTSEHNLLALPPTRDLLDRACRGYEQKKQSLRRRSVEERYAIELIRDALANNLLLPGLDAYFVHQEWRVDGEKVDLLAVDRSSMGLVIIELKASDREARRYDEEKGGDARAQAERYAAAIYEGRHELYPYFERVARAMAQAHGGPAAMQELVLSLDVRPLARVGVRPA